MRLGVWNRAYIVFCGLALIVAPITSLILVGRDLDRLDKVWIDHCESQHLNKTVSDFDGYTRCTDLVTKKKPSIDISTFLTDAALTTLICLGIFWVLCWLSIKVSHWVMAGRQRSA